ncbi:phosphoribosylformylglycinamidine synthase [Clostridium pasteurianum]|uniref:Phosphoribosylformylglycinamidine synthase, clade II n=1 Tax=Clostridium pasteurianum BC1 TaxID=86416 RepID=R4K5G3_CLOPA|nr:phosphoribosylformylglycinamidine synthase [Clostridium pasteurianum]AGK96936.1 phosphoribosylformylglycinamidine synthase, clade II [Clostridium pasteurianum BC1]
MDNKVRRIFVEKRQGFNVEALELLNDVKENLNISQLSNIKIVNRYDISGISDEEFEKAKKIIFSEPVTDNVFEENINTKDNDSIFAVEYLPGQYDQRADSADQCIKILSQNEASKVATAKLYILEGELNEVEVERIKKYCINPVDSREASMEKPETLETEVELPADVKILEYFTDLPEEKLEQFRLDEGLAMSLADLKFCQEYFKNTEKRNPTYTEIKVIDTYWSDHCRHTTFATKLNNVEFEKGKFNKPVKEAFEEYNNSKTKLKREDKVTCLMDVALMAMRELKEDGKLQDLDVSDEINACSIEKEVDIDGKKEKWLIMFKNETHNHPTEIEPFGGAATCIGGCIRDPLSGRVYVYQAMRVTGSGDPRTKIEDTLQGKLPQRKITVGAAKGYSSYGNQIGLATGQVTEVYHEGYVAKRLEVGAVIGAAPKENVVRKEPKAGDIIILLGGRTGRDGCGGATGSSKEHDEKSILTCGAEVQKGNAPTERKIQRLFRNPEVSKLIKRCNDFGAGGVSVAIGELSDGLDINLNLVPKKYEGLDGTELAISESQERMAVVVEEKDADKFIELSLKENLEAVKVAVVTEDRRLKLRWRNDYVVNISRDFLDTNGVRQEIDVYVKKPKKSLNYFAKTEKVKDIKKKWLSVLEDLNVCSQKGLVERFDSTIGAGSVFLPFAGKYQMTPTEAMIAKVPVLKGETNTATVMAHGYNPNLSSWSPFHGAVYSVVEAVAKVVACGGKYDSIRLTLQEYFERLGTEPERWGKPLAALLGAYHAQKMFEIPAIGGKDSMSGTFKDMDVPPTLVAFAVDVVDANKVVSQEFKNSGNTVVLVEAVRDENELPDFKVLKKNYKKINKLIEKGRVLSSYTVKQGGVCEAITKMCLGNKIGFGFNKNVDEELLFEPSYGSIILEIDKEENVKKIMDGVNYVVLGKTTNEAAISYEKFNLDIDELLKQWTKTLEGVFPTKTEVSSKDIEKGVFDNRNTKSPTIKYARPRVFIPVFPGTNCEYDSARAFERAGAETSVKVFKNLTPDFIKESVDFIANEIDKAQMIMLPGGFSAGDEPDGSGKFIASVLRNPKIAESIMKLLKERDGLMLGICNGFQALTKLGLVPFGEIREIDEECPTLTYNNIGRHVSKMVDTRIVSTLSPWFNQVNCNEVYTIPVSHGEGRFVGKEDVIKKLFENGQVATQYVDFKGNPTYDIDFNPNGSMQAIEGITSPDGRILGKMGHSERIGSNIAKNIPGNKDQKIFESGVKYFK